MTNHEKLSPTLEPFYPSPGRLPSDGIFTDGRRRESFIPRCYLEALKVSGELERLGFEFKRAGVTVVTKPSKVATAFAVLKSVLGSDMMSQIPHFILSLTSPKNPESFPSHYSRTITSAIDEPNKSKDSILKEYISRRGIRFLDNPPACEWDYYPEHDEKAEQLFAKEIGEKTKRTDFETMNIVFLAGIARNSKEVSEKILKKKLSVSEIKHGSTVIDLARIAMVLYAWGSKKPSDSLFIISTTRLTNNFDKTPTQAYLLNKMFNALGLNPKWLGICVARVGERKVGTTTVDYRENPTGAVLVEIKPEEYQKVLETVKIQFNQAVEKMTTAKENIGLF